VIVLSPSHCLAFKGVSVYKEGLFNTPLGNIQIDSELAGKLISAYDKADFIPQAFQKEHSLEVELPFLQKVLGDFKLVPVVCGQLDYTDTQDLARALIKVNQGKKVLIVVSTDLSHYYPYLRASEMDSKFISHVKDTDSLGMWQSNSRGDSEACGIVPVLVLLNYAKELGLKPQILNYANSGDVTGDKSKVVGYVSVIFLKGEEEMLSQAQKKRLLEIARQSISDYLSTGKRTDFKESDPALNAKNGAFVTLHKGGNLRGCIGSFTSSEPLYQVIAKMAIESATEDPRFSPTTREELNDIEIEISVLTEPKLIDDWRKIRLGIDGVIVRRGFSSGVFLPQVATETGWSLEEFLSQLCWQKAGLSSDAYKDPKTQLYTFQAYVFSE
jgi:AmmeMemoRadiSam system protein B/AmmeMemoRadiSam system protein A